MFDPVVTRASREQGGGASGEGGWGIVGYAMVEQLCPGSEVNHP